jgi:protein ImuB
MSKRFVSIWFRYLLTDWFSLRNPALSNIPFVLAAPDHGRMVVTAANAIAQLQGIETGNVVADARALVPSLQIADDKPGLSSKLLHGLAEWCIRYTPAVAIDLPGGLILDASGCAHLWGGEEKYVKDIHARLEKFGYYTRIAMADTIGAAWASSRFDKEIAVIERNEQTKALVHLPPQALRLEAGIVERLHKLGLRHISQFIGMPRPILRRRFGQAFIDKLDYAIGNKEEFIQPVHPIEPYQERLPCLEPIVTRTGIEIALQQLLETLCTRLRQEGKGLRNTIFKGYRIDGKIEMIEIGTTRATHNITHLFKLFDIKLQTIEPALGIEVFTLEARKVEDVSPSQEKLWETTGGLEHTGLSELLDRLTGKLGFNPVHRYLPDEHYWPERSIKPAASLEEKPTTFWKTDRPRPLHLLPTPEPIEVAAPIPDYPPMHFRHKGKLHKIIKAEGPERIEQEWWLQQGKHRDYYYVEDEEGQRYWLFRLGHYTGDRSHQWFLHGLFA